MFKRGRSNDTDHTEETNTTKESDTTPDDSTEDDKRRRSRWRNLKGVRHRGRHRSRTRRVSAR